MESALPLDVWWLVCEELTARREFGALYNFSLASRTTANLALPNLYSADDASITGKRKLAVLWRAIILSSVGKTAFPYCLWIRNLKLGDFKELLSDIAPYPDLRVRFFEGSMAPYELLQQPTALNVTTRRNRPRLDLQGISNKVGEAVTTFVKEAAERDNRAVALTHLEGQYVPMDVLPAWTSRLATLMSLHIQDGSVIGEQVAASIRDNCPRFRELTCFYCDGPSVDEDLAAFFRTLRPNTLQVFSVSSKNRLGKEAFAALACHASSLKKLGLSNLQSGAFEHLGALRPCVSLESLVLEGDRYVAVDWHAEYPDAFADAGVWLGDCASLVDLKLWTVPSAAALLKDVLKSSNVRLTTLDLKLVDAHAGLYASLGHQTALEGFYMRSNDGDADHLSPQHAQFVRSLCQCRQLKVLDIMQTTLTSDDLGVLAASLDHLEEFSFDGELLDDSVFDALLAMRKLKTINISANTVFTVDGILQYINSLGALGRPEGGEFGLSIMNQSLQARISPEEEQFLAEHAQATFGGRLEIAHPEEEHESDFSD
ncbi:hypothetical protein SPI_01636 [Niveomyces insectorum RCEF 264]|uniref:Uncharacterized protein n=1 Tax=Niveomyces insectorum RCEF 264 TaxID=1081102 RepID=A0A162MUA1_9HYPO|nr:hypothetical protein SPI_01636 [Niveomyces insectorum RCEF 264]